MRSRSLVIVGVAGIVGLATVAAIAISLQDRGPVVVRDRPTPTPEPAAERPAPVRAAPPSASSAPAPAPADRGDPLSTPWSAVPISARPAQLGIEVAAPIQRGLAAARDAMEPCFEREARLTRAGAPPQAQPGLGSPILLLDLESRAGTIAVVAAELESLGHGSPELVECCQRVLHGYVMSAEQAPPGERYRLRYVLQ